MEKALALLNSGGKQDMNGQNARKSDKAIIIKNGIFTINKEIQTGTVKQDPELKDLVESVLK